MLDGGDGNDDARRRRRDRPLAARRRGDRHRILRRRRERGEAQPRAHLDCRTPARGGSDRLDGIENAVGSARNDALIGSAAANDLRGGEGDDRPWGGAGNDQLRGEDGNDALNGEAGPDVMTGDAGNDVHFADHIGDTAVELAGQAATGSPRRSISRSAATTSRTSACEQYVTSNVK